MTNIYQENVNDFLNEAYQYLKAAYDRIQISKEEFIQEINNAPPKYDVIELVGKNHKHHSIVKHGHIDGWNGLKSLLNEFKVLIDGEYKIACAWYYWESSDRYFFSVVTKKYTLDCERDFKKHRERYIIKYR